MPATTDFSGLDRQLAATRRAAPMVATVGARSIAHQAISEMLAISPVDTGRYKRGWAQAHNFIAGVPRVPVPIIRPTKAIIAERKIIGQVEKFRKYTVHARAAEKKWETLWRARYQNTGRKGKWRADCARKLAKARKTAEKMEDLYKRALEEQQIYEASGGTAIVIGGRKGKTGKIGAQNLATTRARLYGGSINEAVVGDAVFVTATNLEPHASIVEWRSAVVRRANAMARTTGFHRAGFAMAARLRAAAGGTK